MASETGSGQLLKGSPPLLEPTLHPHNSWQVKTRQTWLSLRVKVSMLEPSKVAGYSDLIPGMLWGEDTAATDPKHLEPTQQRDTSAESREHSHPCPGPQPRETGRRGEKNLNCLNIPSKVTVQRKTPKFALNWQNQVYHHHWKKEDLNVVLVC